ncbi:MAG: terminase large subunit [Clostridiales bacterium]|nr:terminase large subunit [Clostridiales bacterium]
MSTYLLQYREAIRKGEIIAGYDMIQELDNLIEDLSSSEYIYDTRDAEIRIDFIEHCIRLTKAPFYGKPMVLLLWEKAFIEALYSFKMKSLDSGEWVDRFQESLLLICRKNGKTELIAALQLTELFIGGEGIDIVCSGTNDGTADLAYQAIDTMRLLIDPKQIDSWRNQKGIKCLINNNHIYKLSDSTRQKEGRNIDIAGIDEVWSLTDEGIYKPIQQSTSTKEKFKILMFGSEGFVDGFLVETRAAYTKIIKGEDDTESAKRKLPWLYTQDSEREVWDTDENGISKLWEKSNPSIGHVKKWSYLRDRVDEARKSKSDRVFVMCKDFNFKQNTAVAWLNYEDYMYAASYDIEDFRGSLILGAVDLSETTDMTSAKALIMRKGNRTKYIVSHYWIPESKLENSDDKEAGAKYKEWAQKGLLTICEGNDIDLTLVADWYYMLYKQYGLRLYKCGYDVKFSKDFLRRMDEYGFECEMIYQDKKTLSSPMKVCEADLKARLVNYNENDVDRWCLKNAAMELDNAGNCQAVKQKAAMRIDGAVTLIILYEVLRRYRSEFMKALK